MNDRFLKEAIDNYRQAREYDAEHPPSSEAEALERLLKFAQVSALIVIAQELRAANDKAGIGKYNL